MQCKEVVVVIVIFEAFAQWFTAIHRSWKANLENKSAVSAQCQVVRPSAYRQHCGFGGIMEVLNIFSFKWSPTFVWAFQILMCFWDRTWQKFGSPSTSEAVISWNKEATEAKLSNIRCWKTRSISKLHKPCWTIYCRTLSTLFTSRLTLQNRWWWSLNTSGSQLLKQAAKPKWPWEISGITSGLNWCFTCRRS